MRPDCWGALIARTPGPFGIIRGSGETSHGRGWSSAPSGFACFASRSGYDSGRGRPIPAHRLAAKHLNSCLQISVSIRNNIETTP